MADDKAKEIEQLYRQLAPQYGLPDYAALNSMFELTDLESSQFLLRNIRRHIITYINDLITEIEGMFHPDSTLKDMYESKVLTDKEKEELFSLFKRLVVFKRRSLLCQLSHDDKEEAALIIDLYKIYPELSQGVSALVRKLIVAWESKQDADDVAGYFG